MLKKGIVQTTAVKLIKEQNFLTSPLLSPWTFPQLDVVMLIAVRRIWQMDGALQQ